MSEKVKFIWWPSPFKSPCRTWFIPGCLISRTAWLPQIISWYLLLYRAWFIPGCLISRTAWLPQIISWYLLLYRAWFIPGCLISRTAWLPQIISWYLILCRAWFARFFYTTTSGWFFDLYKFLGEHFSCVFHPSHHEFSIGCNPQKLSCSTSSHFPRSLTLRGLWNRRSFAF